MNRSLAALLLLTGSLACSDAKTMSPVDGGSADSGGGTDAESTPRDASTPLDGGGSQFKTCTDAELAAATLATNGSDVSFTSAGVDGGALAYTNNCVRIPRGKDVGFYGDFSVHPLAGNGEVGNPIPSLSSGNDSGRIVFPSAGKFGFHCTRHSITMYGTVLVE